MRYKGILTGAIAVAFALIASIAQASVEEIRLAPLPGLKAAEGGAIVRDYLDESYGQAEVAIDVSGLKPNAVYTAWLVRERPSRDMAGLGVKNYAFTTDAQGKGRFVATLSDYELGKWDIIEIAHHPDGNPANLANAEIALRGRLE